MSKGANDRRPKQDRPTSEGPAPPPLSEKLIAKLQHAVNVAQRQRMSDINDTAANPAEGVSARIVQ
jgi:hypothetical protein